MSPRWGLAIFSAVFAFYLLTTGREPAWGDAEPMWAVADAIVDHQGVAIDVRWPEDLPPGTDGRYYGITPLGTALVHVPGAAVAHAAPLAHQTFVRMLATHLAPAALGALACALFFGLLGDLGIRPRTASLCTLILALATTTWVYARSPYSEILQLACFTGFFRATLRVADAPTRRRALALGAWAGCLLNAKYVFAVAIVGAALALAWQLRARRGELARTLGWAALAGAPFAAAAIAYNVARWGAPTATGYEPYLDVYFGGDVVEGAWGMLLSPTKSVFLFSPPLVLAVFGLPAAIRRHPRFGGALLALVLPVFLVYCTYRSWAGDYAWGPRYCVWLVPPLLVGLASWIEASAARWRRFVLAAVCAGGLGVQLLGDALYWDHFIRVAIDAKNQWLGNPDRSGAYVAERGRGHCDSCFEDMYPILWTPPFSQLRGHWWLVTSIARGDPPDGVAAQRDAPWRTETTLQVDLSRTYHRARIDWWGLYWLVDDPAEAALGVWVLVVLAGATGAGAWAWIRAHRTSR